MFHPKLRLALFATLPLLVLVAMSELRPWPNAEEPAAKSKVDELLKERLAVIREIVKQTTEKYKGGTGSIDQVREATRMALEAELELCDSIKERIAVFERFVIETKKNEEASARFVLAGQGPTTWLLKAKSDRLQVEIALERAKTGQPVLPGKAQAAQELQDRVAMAAERLAIKAAAVRVAEAQKNIAAAKLAGVKAAVAEARASESLGAKQFKRMEELQKANSVDNRIVDEQSAKWDAAKARRLIAEANVAEGESQLAVEQARIELAEHEHREALLRLNLLKTRLPR